MADSPGKDTPNSISADPLFVSLTNLHITCTSPAANAGTPIPGITIDIDGQPRSATAPDMGADEMTAPAVISAVSRKTHGAAGTFDIALPGVESRSGGVNGDYQLVVTFGATVNVGSVSIASGTGSVMSVTGNGTNTITVDLAGVTNVQYLTVKLGCTDDGANLGDVSVTMGVLIGDVDGLGSVNVGDTQIAKNHSGEITTQGTAPVDVNADGFINSGDTQIVKNHSGEMLPP